MIKKNPVNLVNPVSKQTRSQTQMLDPITPSVQSVTASIIALCFLTTSISAEPTETRIWRSTAGTKIEASILQIKEGKVQMKLKNGKTIMVPLVKFIAEDQAFIKEFYKKPDTDSVTHDEGELKDSGIPLVTDGLPYEVGKVVGPVDVGGGVSYFLYIPKSLRQGRKAPLLHHNGPGGARKKNLNVYIKGAELNGWIVAASMQSQNNNELEDNYKFAKKDVEHLLKTLPIDKKRIYFVGNSGGGAQTFYNTATMKVAGGIPTIGYIPDGTKLKGALYYILAATTDHNRYLSAHAVDVAGKKNAVVRFHKGGHRGAPEWRYREGMIWLNGRYLAKRAKAPGIAEERLDYETSIIRHIQKLKVKSPYRAYSWCVFLEEDYEITGSNAKILAGIRTELAADPNCLKYVEALKDIDDFSSRYYSPFGESGGSVFAHITPKITKAAEKLAEKYAGVPMIESICKELGKPTVKK